MNRFFIHLVLGTAAVLAGCATAPSTRPLEHSPPEHPPLINVWTQMGPGDETTLRAIVAADATCPAVEVDRVVRVMSLRAPATKPMPTAAAAGENPAFAPPFAVTACELAVPKSAREVRVADRVVPLPLAEVKRIVVVGDTGCRVKLAAGGPGDPIQDCTSSDDWPWPRLAAAAAATRPDLVIHVGDYHYRESCGNPASCAALAEKGVAVGYGWAGWEADFFRPATPLLAAAPWVFVRGNHENCDRAGEGWMRFLSPLPYQPCTDQRYRSATRSLLGNNQTASAYRITVGKTLGLIVADNSAHEDFRMTRTTPDDVRRFEHDLSVLREAPADQDLWFLSHRPIWYDLIAPAAQPNALQSVLKQGLSARLQMAIAGHQHVFSTLNFKPDDDPSFHPAGRPAQVIVGAGGSRLEAADPQSPFYEGKTGRGSKERARPDGQLYDGVMAASGILLHRYSFLLVERAPGGWNGTLLGADGKAITRCRLDDGKKVFDCTFPTP